ncbi:DUF3810 domain-containing protein [Sporofaciens musculi]|uniref:DUF3810 domain-containing protein n=1 Tax=Sporofaciens musculi TaxID=2681861 RepID=UPI002570CE88|nr:DUF3810 domain-containing protein [Sporofaciens musculi]
MAEEGRVSKKNHIKLFISVVLWSIALVLSIAARFLNGFAQWYSTHIYPLWVGSVGRMMGYIPFSMSEMLLYLLLIGTVVWIVGGVIGKIAGGGLYSRFMNLFLLAGGLCFLYVVNCGINYHRQSFSDSSGIQIAEYSSEELEDVCIWLTSELSELSGRVERDEKGGMALEFPAEEYAVKAMKKLALEYPELTGYFPRPKELVNSCILSVQNLTGVYSPFTIEANFNGDVQDYVIPFTACHELSHLRGFMQEQEANFIAFLACSRSGEDAFAYSGYLSGWIQCMNVLYKTDYDVWSEVRSLLPEEAEADLKLNREFWAKYDGTIAEVSNKVNDTYLKANGQKEGVKSYNRMVDLIVSYYNSEILK